MITRRSTLVCAIFVCLILLPFSAQAATPHFSAVYVFGDSYCDVGNLYAYVGAPGFPYLPGRRSNGPLWVEHVANAWGLPMKPSVTGGTDYARGQARKSSTLSPWNRDSPIPNVPQQIAQYLNDHGRQSRSQRALYILERRRQRYHRRQRLRRPSRLSASTSRSASPASNSPPPSCWCKTSSSQSSLTWASLPAASPNNSFATQATLATNKYLGDLLKLEETFPGHRHPPPRHLQHDAVRRQRSEPLRLHRHHPSLHHRHRMRRS